MKFKKLLGIFGVVYLILCVGILGYIFLADWKNAFFAFGGTALQVGGAVLGFWLLKSLYSKYSQRNRLDTEEKARKD
ncbi:MAG: hypothetical protein CO093_07545 [Alphaproteobacteria bacterium CG_4_9_14_3_um_filter_47_13]|nr:MAG: hypothetical protein CO093_07545 [Alphaproteobacteria bacterium CG_4_9_14_3_um_filter_47_13]